MRSSLRLPLTALALAVLALSAAACNKPGDKAKTITTAEAKPGDKATDAIPGLPTEKAQTSYMIGMAMGKQLELMKDDVDVDTIAKAIKSSFAGDKLLLTNEQAAKIGETFYQNVQAKQIAKMLADAKQNAEAGEKFMAENAKKPGIKTTASGLQYQVVVAGKGPTPKPTDTVHVNYKGSLLDGTVFDDSSTHGGPAEIPLQQVVPGWQEGMALMPVGSKYKFWIPGRLGYGEKGTPGGPIPPNATLVFEIELLDIAKPAGK